VASQEVILGYQVGPVLKKIGYQHKFKAVQHETRNIGARVKLKISGKKVECVVEY